jgi:hypothetical protein
MLEECFRMDAGTKATAAGNICGLACPFISKKFSNGDHSYFRQVGTESSVFKPVVASGGRAKG